MTTAFDEFLTAMYAATNRRPQLVSESLRMYVIEKASYLDFDVALSMNIVIRDIGQQQVRVGLMSFKDLNTDKEHVITRSSSPFLPNEPMVNADGTLTYGGFKESVMMAISSEVLDRLANDIRAMLQGIAEHERRQQEIAEQLERERLATEHAALLMIAEKTHCPVENVKELHKLVGSVVNADLVTVLVTQLAEREAKLLNQNH